MDAKYLVFYLALTLGVPAGTLACIFWPRIRRLLVVVMIWSTCLPDQLGINFLSREFYRSMTRGLEITVADLLGIILSLSMILKARNVRFKFAPPLTGLFWIYLSIAIATWIATEGSLPIPSAAELPYPFFETSLYPFFEITKILRGLLIYLVIVNYVRTPRDARDIILGVLLSALWVAWVALSDRYLHGVHRVRATLGHANSLATYMAMLGSFAFVYLAAARKLMHKGLYAFILGATLITVILTISRGGIIALATGICLGYLLFIRQWIKPLNLLISLAGIITAGFVFYIAADTLAQRFFGDQDAREDMEYRALYNAEARSMAADHPLGVGLGNFSAWSWNGYAEQVSPDLPPGTPPHNIWYHTLGETGWPGLLVFAFIWVRFALLSTTILRAQRTDPLITLAIACLIAIIVMHVQSLCQLVYRQSPIYMMTRIFMGVVVAVRFQQKSRHPSKDFSPLSTRPPFLQPLPPDPHTYGPIPVGTIYATDNGNLGGSPHD
jgi:O-antigen ligase